MEDKTDIDKQLEEIKKSDMAQKDFAAAKRRLFELRVDHPEHQKLAHLLAVCTYKDVETAPAKRYAEALQVLESIGLGNTNVEPDPETLRLGGAIYKRKWQFDGRLDNLYHAYSLYREAADKDPNDLGYGGVNAAFILDLLSARARVRANRTGVEPVEANRLSEEAEKLRIKTIERMDKDLTANPELKNNLWFAPTYAEAHFGVGNYDIAHEYLRASVEAGLEGWEKETSFRQLVSIAKAQGIELPSIGEVRDEENWHPAWKALRAYLGEGTRQALECYRGRVGLALSGGGFRASFYHIGVLARLAEMDVLRSVEVLSTVSGGSIVGAHYYLEVQNLLQTRADAEITREDYIQIVERLRRQFFAGVSKNLRMRTFADPIANILMLFSEKYSRSQRIARLYERDLYSNIGQDKACRNCSIKPRNMPDLLIKPKGEDGEDFNPNRDNWLRHARAPVLLLNTTSLNSGHNWRFTAKWMGEPPGTLGDKIDKNSRYRWVDYDKQDRKSQINLGNAVAASACVPGLFEPLVIGNLYKDHTVKLVDGGVHDNQGVAGLLDEHCTLILCSDASGQMSSEPNPGSTTLGVPLRSNSILMDRVREIQYQDLAARVESRALEGLFFIHLKSDLSVERIFPAGIKDPDKSSAQANTAYGIHPEIQQKIAALRTDLDCFTEVEANALMLSGYKTTDWQFRELQRLHQKSGEAGTWGNFDVDAESRGDYWSFLDRDFVDIASRAPETGDAATDRLARQLDVGASTLFKVFKTVPAIKLLGILLLVLIAGICAVWVWNHWEDDFLKITVGGAVVAIVLFLGAFLWPVVKWLNPRSVLENKVLMFVIGIVGSLVSLVQVYVLDRIYLGQGTMARLKASRKS